MATVKLGSKAVGSIVKIGVKGSTREFIVVHQGLPSNMYDASCNGTWLLLKDIYETKAWHSSNVNDYANSTVHSYLSNTFLNLIDVNIRAQIKQAKIPYRPGSGTSQTVNSGANGLSAKIFLLSDREVGYTQSNVNQYIVNDGAKLSYFQDGNGTTEKIAKPNGSAAFWWLRSPYTRGSTGAWLVRSDGSAYDGSCSGTGGARPALILPSTLLVSDDGSVNTNRPRQRHQVSASPAASTEAALSRYLGVQAPIRRVIWQAMRLSAAPMAVHLGNRFTMALRKASAIMLPSGRRVLSTA